MSSSVKRVLIIEDEKPLAHALQLKLRFAGFEVEAAADGQAGVELLKSNTYDVLLLDLIMPVMDGFQVLEQLKTSKRPRPIIFVLSNLSQHDDEKRALDLGADKFYIKSDISLVDLVQEISEATGLVKA